MILRSDEGLTTFNKNNRLTFLAEKGKNEAFWGV